jgi:hypothetical protein
MSIEQIIKYPFDSTATSPTNFIPNEKHVVNPGGQNTLVLRNGPFYSESLVVRTPSAIEPLQRNVDYLVLYLFEDATMKTGKEVHIAISMIDPNWHGELLVTYQTVGGAYSSLYPAVVDVVNQIKENYETVSFNNLQDLPVAFHPLAIFTAPTI